MATDHASMLYGFGGARFPDREGDHAGLPRGMRRQGSQDKALAEAEQRDNVSDGDDLQPEDVGTA